MGLIQVKSSEYFRTQNFIYFGLLAGQIIPILIFSYTATDNQMEDLTVFFEVFAAFLAVAGIIGGHYIFNYLIKQKKESKELKQKMATYNTALIVKFAMLEVPSIFCIVSYNLTAEISILIIMALSLITFLIHKPSRSKAIRALNLTKEEIEQINDPQAVISVYHPKSSY